MSAFCSQSPITSISPFSVNGFNLNPTGFGRPSTQNFIGFCVPPIDITVSKITDKLRLENALGGRSEFNISVVAENSFHDGVKEIIVNDVGTLKYMCFSMPGVDRGSLSVDIDTSSRFLRISGKRDERLADVKCITPFCIDRAAPDGRRFVIDKSRIALTEGILYIEYQLESCMDFQKIF